MTAIEKQMTGTELDKIHKRLRISIILWLIFMPVFLSVASLIFFTPISDIIKYIIAIILVITTVAIIITFIRLQKKTRKDIRQRIKIIEELKIIDKKIIKHLASRHNETQYHLTVDSEYFTSLRVESAFYQIVKENSVLDIEYTKNAKWILKLEYEGKSYDVKNITGYKLKSGKTNRY